MTMNDNRCRLLRALRFLCALTALVSLLNSGTQTASGRGGGGNRQNQQQQQPAPPTPPTPDDPLVKESAPPPAEAKMIVKVGWCEVQVFGHTFRQAGLTEASLPAKHIHLSQRLEQLSHKLQFESGKSGIQLMDDVDALVKYVSANKNSAALTGRFTASVS